MKVDLPEDIEKFVDEEVASGRYASAQEVVCGALISFQEQARARDERLARLNEQIEEGLSQLDRGEGISSKSFFRTLRQRGRERRQAS